MSVCLDTSKWSQSLWRSHLRHAPSARRLLAQGTARQAQYEGFADDIHGLLYTRSRPQSKAGAPTWATDLLQQAQELPEWHRLKTRCLQRGFAAGVATEALLGGLKALIPQQEAPEQHGRQRPQQRGGRPQAGQPGQPGQDDGSTTRRTMRQAMREAGEAVDQAESAVEGLTEALGMEGGAGTGTGASETLVSVERVQQLHSLLAHNRVMQQMAQMAGRLQRMVASQKRGTSAGRVGAITGIELGGDLPRILPTELAGLRVSRLARLRVLAKIQQKRALQYAVTSEEPEASGPVIVLMDKSGSLNDTQVAWEAAFALTLLTLCRQQGRTFGALNFDWTLHDEVVVEAQATADPNVVDKLLHFPGGGTNFERPLARALTLLQEQPTLRKADIFFLTDGCPSANAYDPSLDGNVTPATLTALQALTETEGLSIYGIGIGPSAQLDPIRAIATETFHMSADPQQTEGELVPLLAALA